MTPEGAHTYFAYGSNLWQPQMRVRCPQSVIQQSGVLAGFKLSFTSFCDQWGGGVADVIVAPGHHVLGLLWTLSDPDLTSLDGFEGHPQDYQRTRHEVVGIDGTAVTAWVYQVVNKKPYIAPSDKYLNTIIEGGRALNLPADYLRFLESFRQPNCNSSD